MRPHPPLDIPWVRKPLSSAETSVTVLPTGQIKLWIRHDVIRGVTPAMLVWWFQHLEGTIEIAGQTISRYRAWHPIDHYALTYHRRCPDGSIGPGAVLHIQEFFGGNPDWKVDVLTTIVKLDETGFVHEPRRAGIVVGRMEYEFEPVEGGTRYTNWLIAGIASPLGRIVNPLLRRVAFSDPQARAWLTHNVEEVGNFESFLPGLYARRDESASGR